MNTIKISILGKDGAEYDEDTEMDLNDALNHIGFSPSGFNIDTVLVDKNFNFLFDKNGNMLVSK